MKRIGWLCALSLVIAVMALLLTGAAKTPTTPSDFRQAFKDGNYKDAYDGLSPLVLSAGGTDQLEADFNVCVAALQPLGRTDEIDDFREKAVAAHIKDWRFLWEVARSYRDVEHYGQIVAGKFYRGNSHSGPAKWVNSFDRDRVRALQLMQQAMNFPRAGNGPTDEAKFYDEFAGMLLQGMNGPDAWRLQTLTDFTTLPDYDESQNWGYGWGAWGGGTRGAPVDEQGQPVFYHVPKEWQSAKNDGERWRWALERSASYSKADSLHAQFEFAQFLHSQFGVQTMAEYRALFDDQSTEAGKKDESGPFAVHTLKDDETIAKLASGIKRFTLPEEFSYIKILQSIAANAENVSGIPEAASDLLAQIYEDRQQYDTAAEWWKKDIARFGEGSDHYRKNRLDQIVANWGMFESALVQPAGDQGAKVDFRFRNGDKVSFTANEVDVPALLADVKAYLKTKPNEVDQNRVEIGNIGWRLVEHDEKKYIGKQVAAWDLKLIPRDHHFDKRITVETPLKKAGAYLLVGKMDNGNVSRIIVWVADTVIVRKQLSGAVYTYVADATTGQPIPKAIVDFFGYRQQWINDKKYRMDIQEFSATADGDGQVIVPMAKGDSDKAPPPVDPAAPVIAYNFDWMTTATTKDDKGNARFAFMGFAGIWASAYYDAYDSQYNQTKAFIATDRPVYRPGDKVQWKMWVGHNKYDQDGKNPFAGEGAGVEIRSPKGDVVKKISGTLDEWGGMSGEFVVGKEATLGMYSVSDVSGWGGVQFRVEEYKKPEFEVNVEAPSEPIMLGDKATATIRAKYYFGAPVVNAKVKYKVTRTAHDARWYPAGPWDWFYEPGYWWFGCDYLWYPGWERWGCWRPIHGWWPGGFSREQPEIVSENEVPIGPDGTVKVDIDTSVAKAAYGDEDHQYDITAEVTDASRRTIVGTGQVLVAREPFKVYVWLESGYYHVGDTVQAHFSAQTVDNKPVKGKGTLKLLRVTYDEHAQPSEASVQSWDLPTDVEGQSSVQIKAAEAGQYRLSYTVTDEKGRSMEGGYVFVVRGEGFDGKEFRFNDIEIVTDKKEYAAGDKVKLMVNANRADATVLLFIRPTNGIYLPPKVLRLKGKSAIEEVDVGMKDMPNFFIEALTVGDAHVYTDVREVIVPPAQRILNVSVAADAPGAEYKPGQKAKLTLKVTEQNGEPFTGAAVLALYDKSVEYISGGSNVQDIRKYFWQWRRQHYVQTQSSLDISSGNIVRSNEVGMAFLGVFGEMATEFAKDKLDDVADTGVRSRREISRNGAAGAVFQEAKSMSSLSSPAPMTAVEMPALAPGTPAGPPSPHQVEPTVRTNFADTACWSPNIVTAKDGTAIVEVTMPESLTTWKAKVWTFGAGSRVGQGETEVITRKNLIVRLESPRFFVQSDQVILSAIVHNYLKSAKRVVVQLQLEGDALVSESPTRSLDGRGSPQTEIEVPANGEQRVDFPVRAIAEGMAKITMKALTDEESDAMQMSFPVYVHGMSKMDSFSGAIREGTNNASVTINVPKERRPEQSRLEIRYSPTLAGAMVDALPYLADYPYGCTEQTLNRFVPTVITQKVLLDMHLDLAAIEKKRTNLNAQEIGNDAQRAAEWKHFDRNPVFDKQEVTRMVREGVTRLSNMQLSDGGWGWFSGTGEQSYPHTTAVVVHGLQVARDNGASVDANVLDRGIAWLVKFQTDRVTWIKEKRKERTSDDLDAFVYMVLVDADHDNTEMRKLLYEDRNGLGVYAKAMFGLALSTVKDQPKLQMILDNCRQYVVQDDEDQTAYLKMPESGWWYWYDSEFEADAYYLKLLARTDPKGQVASRLAKYLINNRRHATYWNSTRDTALCIEALAEYVRASGEMAPAMTVHIALDGRELKQEKITAENLFTYDNKVVLTGADVPDGQHIIQVTRDGVGPLYFNAYLTNFTLENHITAAGLEIKVHRKIYLLTEADKTVKAEGSHGHAVDERVEKYVRTELTDGQSVKSGDLVEVELEVDSKNDYEYILLEDMKAAGFEPVEVRSGYNGNDMGAYVEFHDERVAFFVHWLSRGKHSVSYRLRAEVPGNFSALPTKASAMYAPELKANSDELKLRIFDAPSVIHE